jgi:hypothetical protein
MAEYGLTSKQAAYVYQTLHFPEKTLEERGEAAGYDKGGLRSDGGRVLKSAGTLEAIKAEGLAIKQRSEALVEAIKTDARGAIRGELARHANSPDIAPNQTRALELLGKMEGVFIERVELDAGPHTRARFADEVIEKMANPSQETE